MTTVKTSQWTKKERASKQMFPGNVFFHTAFSKNSEFKNLNTVSPNHLVVTREDKVKPTLSLKKGFFQELSGCCANLVANALYIFRVLLILNRLEPIHSTLPVQPHYNCSRYHCNVVITLGDLLLQQMTY